MSVPHLERERRAASGGAPAAPAAAGADLAARADERAAASDPSGAIELYLAAAAESELPDGELCVKIARCHHRLGAPDRAVSWLARIPAVTDRFRVWQAGASLLGRIAAESPLATRRAARVWVTGSYTTPQLSAMLPLAALPAGLALTVREGGFDQYRQDILDPGSELYRFDPDFVVLAVHEGAAELPALSSAPAEDVAREAGRWQSLWSLVSERSRARVVQHTFAVRPDPALGNLAASVPGSRHHMLQALNLRLGEAAQGRVSLVDCDRLAGAFGKLRWFDDRYWARSKQAVALDAVPSLATETAAVIGAAAGLNRKCLVLDLDNTLWGGVVGEDGMAGIRLGGDPVGEAFTAFQEFLLELKRKGVILAVASKNNPADAREVFERHPEMRLRLDDVAVFLANWEDKPASIRRIAETLNIGLDALVFVDDNPAEREAVRQLVPEVDVVPLPADPARYVQALARYPWLETASLTDEDRRRTAQYQARAQIADLQARATTMDEFLEGLEMRATIAPFNDLRLPRITQLVNKTNQFNLTTRRYSETELRRFAADDRYVDLSLELRDRFADHGLVGVLIARHDGDEMDIDTFLMSCRVVGRTVEAAMLERLRREAVRRGCDRLVGRYVPSAKNALAKDVYETLGFVPAGREGPATLWTFDLREDRDIAGGFVVEETDG